ncbi:MAG: hypothetical protein JW955_12125 [Sedimentisphaerales bacterium]|nr:hypothetical protein [Sedimentisphaerales bacterium]
MPTRVIIAGATGIVKDHAEIVEWDIRTTSGRRSAQEPKRARLCRQPAFPGERGTSARRGLTPGMRDRGRR